MVSSIQPNGNTAYEFVDFTNSYNFVVCQKHLVQLTKRKKYLAVRISSSDSKNGGRVAEWLGCWTSSPWVPGSNSHSVYFMDLFLGSPEL